MGLAIYGGGDGDGGGGNNGSNGNGEIGMGQIAMGRHTRLEAREGLHVCPRAAQSAR